MQPALRRMFSLALVVGVLLLVLLSSALYVTIVEARASSAAVSRTQDVLEVAGSVANAALQLDAGQRGVLVTGAAHFRAARDEAIGALHRGVANLGHLTSDQPAQQERVRALAVQVDRRAAIAARSERLSGSDLALARAAIVAPEALEAARAIQAILADIVRDERSLLAARQAHEDRLQRRTLWIVAIAIALSAALLAWAAWGLRREAHGAARAESRFRDLVQALPVSVWLLRADPQHRLKFEFVSENTRSHRHLDVDVARADYERAFHTIHEEDRPAVAAAMDRSLRTLEPFDVRYRVPTADGRLRWVQSSARLRRDADGTVLLSGFWSDITEEHRLREALAHATREAEEATRAKSAFLAAMSHEIRTPMNGVLGLLELLSLTDLDAEQRGTLSVVRSSGQSLLRIVDDILDFSKMEADRLRLDPQPGSLRQVVEGACQVHAGLASGKGLLLRSSIDPAISPVLAFDRQRLGQVLNNLISNALKFTERGSVAIEARLVSREGARELVSFVVRDTGIGVAEEDLLRLFQPFVQSGEDTAGRFGGTGLGLVISRRLAELMGGSLAMESVRGQGTTMTLTCPFPVVDAAAPPADEAAVRQRGLEALVARTRIPPPPAEAAAEGTLVLLVDDHPTNRMVLKRQLNSLGYAAEVAADGRRALEAWRSGRFALVIADCNMPEMSGYELTRAIRAEEAARGLRRTPVFACTANAMPNEVAACRDAGMDEYLVKPTGLGELAARLGTWLPLPETAPGGQRLPAAVDPRLLSALSGGDLHAQAEILAGYRAAQEEDAGKLREAVRDRDLSAAVALAHRIRGASASVGSAALAEAAGCLEDAARAGHAGALDECMAAVDAELGRVLAALPAPPG